MHRKGFRVAVGATSLAVVIGLSLWLGGPSDMATAQSAAGSEAETAKTMVPDLARGREVYDICVTCHLAEGWGLDDGTYPQLAGQHPAVIVKQLSDIRSLNRDNPIMYRFALPSQIGGTQAIVDVAGYIANLPMSPTNGVGSGKDLAYGKKLYAENCVRCHGAEAEGNNEKVYPRLQGQHYKYLLRQFKWIRDGKRRNADPEMRKQIWDFNDRAMAAVMDYVSRLSPPPDMVAPEGWKNPDYK